MSNSFEQNPKLHSFFFTINGETKKIEIIVYPKVKAHFALMKKNDFDIFDCLYNSIQRRYLDQLIRYIGDNNMGDNQARAAISFVQQIPYDEHKARIELKYDKNSKIRYPYEVIYDNLGICSEKSLLLALLLKELGYSIALFEFEEENHMAVGIKSPMEFSYNRSGFAFIETSGISIPTDIQLQYQTFMGRGPLKLKSNPKIIRVSEGDTFSSIYQEWFDAKILNDRNSKDFQVLKVKRKYGIL